MNQLYLRAVSGALDQLAPQYGGLQCYHTIPFNYHALVSILIIILNISIVKCFSQNQTDPSQRKERSYFEIVYGSGCLILHGFNCYLKYEAHNMIFLLNPCYVVFTGLIVMLLWPVNTPFLQRFHSYWLSWSFAPLMMMMFPYNWGSTPIIQIVLSYSWHMMAVLGPFVLMRRYGGDILNLVPGYCSFVLYNFVILVPVSRMTMVNLDYMLCNFSGDPVFNLIGHHFIIFYSIFLFLVSFATRIIIDRIYKFGQ